MSGIPGEPARAQVADSIPRGLQIAGAWSWRLLAIGAVIAASIYLIIVLRLIVIPVLISVLIAALLVPFERFLVRRGAPRWLSIVVTMLTMIAVVAGLLFLAVFQVGREFSELQRETVGAFHGFREWLSTGPFQLSRAQIAEYITSLRGWVQADGRPFISGVLSVGSTVGHLLAGTLLALFSTLFILIDGAAIWSWIVRVFPQRASAAVDGAGRTGWATLRNFARVQILVASIDAVGIALGALILGLPLVAPIGVLVFLGSFIPIVGAVLTGALAVFVALVFKGWVVALIMLAVVLAVQQIEGHVLQPLIMGSAVKVHPLAVVLSVAAGSFLAGIAGALFAVPAAAVVNVMVHYIADGAWRGGADGDRLDGLPLRSPLWQTVPRQRWVSRPGQGSDTGTGADAAQRTDGDAGASPQRP